MKHYGVRVAGASASGQVVVSSPFDQSDLGTVDTIDTRGVHYALARAQELFDRRDHWLPAAKRIAILNRAANLMQQRAEELALLAVAEGGKPLKDTRAEVARAIDGMHNCAELLRHEHGREIPMSINPASAHRLAFTHHEPIGVVAAASAFNHPLNLIVHQVGPAIAAGCPVIIKPAAVTPLSCFNLVEILEEAGLPEGWCQPVLTDSHASSEVLFCDPRVSFFSFIGSARVGWDLRSKLAPGTRCALEHGGVAPVIVDRSANLKEALPLIAKGGFYHAGQVCVSVQRVFAQREIVDEVAQSLAVLASESVVGDPASETTDIGPLIRHRETERIERWVKEAIAAGAKLMTGGEAIDDAFFPATVLLNPPPDAKVSTEEIFGPVICVYAYDKIDEAIQRANALPYAFQAAVFSRHIDTALYAFQRLSAASVMINDHTAFRVDWMPFAGHRLSGHGTGGIPYTYREMTQEKLLVLHSSSL